MLSRFFEGLNKMHGWVPAVAVLVIVAIVVCLFLGLAIGGFCLARLIVAVAGGFGYTLPFWPVVGGWALFTLVIGALKSR